MCVQIQCHVVHTRHIKQHQWQMKTEWTNAKLSSYCRRIRLASWWRECTRCLQNRDRRTAPLANGISASTAVHLITDTYRRRPAQLSATYSTSAGANRTRRRPTNIGTVGNRRLYEVRSVHAYNGIDAGRFIFPSVRLTGFGVRKAAAKGRVAEIRLRRRE